MLPTSFRVVTRDGKQHEGTARVDDSGITLDVKGKSQTIRKEDVVRIYYVRLKPRSDGARYSDEERFPLDPELWPYYLNLGVRMRVLLYDSAAPQDDAPIHCPAVTK